MDKKKKMNIRILTSLLATVLFTHISAGTVEKIQFCGVDYSYSSDSLGVRFNILDSDGKHLRNVHTSDLYDHLHIYQRGNLVNSGEFESLSGGIRIPKENTVSVLIDRGIAPDGKEQIFSAVRNLVASAPDSCVYLSFFGDDVTESRLVTMQNFEQFRDELMKEENKKFFYGALYSKLIEFDAEQSPLHPEYKFNRLISQRANANPEKTSMFVFVDGNKMADVDDPVQYIDITQGASALKVRPTIYAFYYSSGSMLDEDLQLTLSGLTGESASMAFPKGKYVSAADNALILREIGKAIDDQKYDYVFRFKAGAESYSGLTLFLAKWNDLTVGEAEYMVGTHENPWPVNNDGWSDTFLMIMTALLVTLLTILFFFIVMRVIIPSVKSKSFSMKYYKRYEPEYGVNRRICSYCKQPIEEGQMIVNKCQHIMHVDCWRQNGYRCAEYGQNCTTGYQEHLHPRDIFSKESFLECRQAISGICAGFVSWVVYELIGRGVFPGLASGIAGMFLTEEPKRELLLAACTSKVESFLAIGMILGFFLSLIFRWNEEFRKKNATIYLKIVGFSLLSALIGFLAFAFGGVILCMLVGSLSTSGIPWYCSLPAYVLFSICVSLSLTLKTSIPVKSAMIGGLCSALIGFLVLYFTGNSTRAWMNMLLDFIIYGGGLGASLVTVRMLAEKYFLVIQTGVKKGVRIPIHKWMNAIGGGNKVAIGMTGDCEIQMNWEKSNKVAKEHAVLYIDQAKSMPVIKPMATNVIFNSRAELPVRRPAPLSNGDTFKIGDTVFLYEETD